MQESMNGMCAILVERIKFSIKFIKIFIETAKIPCFTSRLSHSSDRSYDPISCSRERLRGQG